MREIFFAALLLQVLMTSSAGRRMRRDLTMSTEKRPGRNYFTEDPEDSDGASIGQVAYVSFGGIGSAETEKKEKSSQDGPMGISLETEERSRGASEKTKAKKGGRSENFWNDIYESDDARRWRENTMTRPVKDDDVTEASGVTGAGKGVTGFSAVRASRESQDGRRGRITLESTFTNFNQGWSASDSIFVCYEPGLYSFSFSARGQHSSGSSGYYPPVASSLDMFNDVGSGLGFADILESRWNGRTMPSEDCLVWIVSLMLNGKSVVSIGGGNDTSASNNVLVPLGRGDRVWLQLNRGRLVEVMMDKGGLTSFTGFRVGDISTASDSSIEETRMIQEDERRSREKPIGPLEDFNLRRGVYRDQNWITGVRTEPQPRPYYPYRREYNF